MPLCTRLRQLLKLRCRFHPTAYEPSPFEDQPWGRGVPLRKLGIRLCFAWELAAEHQNGVLIATGATGSGRTTTLTSTVLFLAREGRFHRPGDDESLLRMGQVGDVMLFGHISIMDRAQLAYKLAESGMLVLATMAHSSFDALTMLRDFGISGKSLDLTRAIVHQKLAPKVIADAAGCKYQGRTLISHVHAFDQQNTVDKFLTDRNYGEMHFLSDLIEKLNAGVIDLDEIEHEFSTKVFSMFGRRLP